VIQELGWGLAWEWEEEIQATVMTPDLDLDPHTLHYHRG